MGLWIINDTRFLFSVEHHWNTTFNIFLLFPVEENPEDDLIILKKIRKSGKMWRNHSPGEKCGLSFDTHTQKYYFQLSPKG